MTTGLKKIADIFDRIVNLMAILAGVMLISVMLFVGFGVFTRYFLNRPIAWGVELTEVSLLWFTLLNATWLLRRDGHVKMGIIVEQFKPGTQTIIDGITSTISALMFLIFAIFGVQITWESFEKGLYMTQSVLEIPSGYILVIIPIASFMLFVQCLRRAWGRFSTSRSSAAQETQENHGPSGTRNN